MASVDSLPPDQRAVLQLVLQRGRSYDEIARLLSIDRAAVRERALSAFDALGPQTGVPDQRRALITDYLLSQLPPALTDQTRDRLAHAPGERAWARVLASELAPLAGGGLPEIPVDGSSVRASDAEPGYRTESDGEAEPRLAHAPPSAAPFSVSRPTGGSTPAAGSAEHVSGRKPRPTEAQTGRSGASSRRGGLIVLLVAAVIVAAVVVILIGSGGSTPKATASSSATSSTVAASSTSTSAGSSAAGHVLAQINLKPTSASSKAAGIAEVLKQGTTDGVAIVAQNVVPNTTKPPNAYAVWLYNSPSDAHILGFVNPGVGVNGRLSTAGGLPANAVRYKQLIVTLETQASPKAPGTIVLQGALTGL